MPSLKNLTVLTSLIMLLAAGVQPSIAAKGPPAYDEEELEAILRAQANQRAQQQQQQTPAPPNPGPDSQPSGPPPPPR